MDYSKTPILMNLNFKNLTSFIREGMDNLGGIGLLPSGKVRSNVDYIITCRNMNHEKSQFGPSEGKHGSAYIIAKVLKSIPVETKQKDDAKRKTKRCRVLFKEFAYLPNTVIWKTQTNIMRYTTLEELLDDGYDIDLDALEWQQIPEDEKNTNVDEVSLIRPLNKEQATECLAMHYGVSPDKIKLTVELL